MRRDGAFVAAEHGKLGLGRFEMENHPSNCLLIRIDFSLFPDHRSVGMHLGFHDQ